MYRSVISPVRFIRVIALEHMLICFIIVLLKLVAFILRDEWHCLQIHLLAIETNLFSRELVLHLMVLANVVIVIPLFLSIVLLFFLFIFNITTQIFFIELLLVLLLGLLLVLLLKVHLLLHLLILNLLLIMHEHLLLLVLLELKRKKMLLLAHFKLSRIKVITCCKRSLGSEGHYWRSNWLLYFLFCLMLLHSHHTLLLSEVFQVGLVCLLKLKTLCCQNLIFFYLLLV